MASFNRVILMGNLTRDPEVRYANSGTAIVKFSLAVNRRWKDANDQYQDEATFVDCTMFGKRGEAFSKFHFKGKPALIEGHLRLDTWDDKQTGAKRSKLYVVADTWEFVGGKEDANDPSTQGQPQQGQQRNPLGGGQPDYANQGGGYVDNTPF